MLIGDGKQKACRYCGKPIVMVRTRKGVSVPVEPRSRWYREDENGAAFIRIDGEVIRGSSCEENDSRAAGIGYINHDAVCEQSPRGKRRGKKARKEESR